MKKTLVSALLVLTMLLGCVGAFAEVDEIFPVPEQYDMPIVTDGSVKLTVYMAMESGSEKGMLTYDEHTAIQEWEKRTGVDFTFIHPPKNDDGTYFNNVIASGDLPDIFIYGDWNNKYAGGVEGAINDGILIDLNPYVEKFGYHYLTEAHKNWDDEAKRNFMTDEGMYRFGAASQRVPVLGQQHTGMVVRGDVLKELGMDPPETIDQVTEMLRAFKEKGFEVPLALSKLDKGFFQGSAYLSSWAGVKPNKFMLDENGKVTYSRLEPGFKDYLTLLNSWMQEGLIDRDFPTREEEDARTMFTSGKSAMVCVGNWQTQELNALGKVTDENFDLIGLTAPVKDEASIGQPNPFAEPIVNGENGMYWGITTTCAHPEEAFKALDYLYSYEGAELMCFGVEKLEDGTEIHWTNEDGTRQFSDFILNNPDLEYNSIRYIYTIQNLSSEYASEMEYMQYGEPVNAQCWEAWTKNANRDRVIPNMISLTAEESQTLVTKMNEIETFIYDKDYKIIFGDDSIENYDSYLEQIKGMGLDECIKIQQDAYDRYIAR